MSSEVTILTRTHPPGAFDSLMNCVEFQWRTTLDELSQDQIRMKVRDALNSGDLDGIPAVAIVRWPDGNDNEDDVQVDVYDCLGKRICNLVVAANGLGKVRSVDRRSEQVLIGRTT